MPLYLEIVIILAIAPGLLWLWYFYRKDKLEREPLHLIRRVFLVGALGTIPAVLLEWPFDVLGRSVLGGTVFITAVVVAPVVEEVVKFFVVWWTIYRDPEFDEPMDGITYSAAAALGFATLENIGYVLGQVPEGSGAVAAVGGLRAFLSVPGHALFSSMWGYALGLAKFSTPARGKQLVVMGLFLAIIVHGTFNLLCSIGPYWALGMLIFIPLLWKMVHRRIKAALKASPHFLPPTIE